MKRFFIACTPRTGNLWFRKLLTGSLGIMEMAAHNPEEVSWQTLPPECAVAMHWDYSSPFVAMLRSLDFTPVVTARHPLDVLISILQFSQSEPTARWLEGRGGSERVLRNADPASPEFLQYALSDRAAALLSVSAAWRSAAREIIRYEDLVKDPEAVLRRVLNTFGRSPRVPLPEVVAAHTFARLRPISTTHMWRGIPGLWRELLPEDRVHVIYRRHRLVFESLGYQCDHPAAPTREVARERWRALCAGDASWMHSGTPRTRAQLTG
jgi:hypothetical protein